MLETQARMWRMAAVISLHLLLLAPLRSEEMKRLIVDADFPGGNIIVDRIEGDDVYLHQDLRDTTGDWFYWHFRVRGCQGRKLTFHFTKGNPIGVLGPAWSVNGGKAWKWLGTGAVRGATFQCDFPDAVDEARFCFAFPYQEHDLHEFLRRFDKNAHLRVESLCKTSKGRDVELISLGRFDGKCQHRVALTCRHHSCEMMSSYVLEGIIEEVLAESNAGNWLREHVEFFIVPMVDKDGVEDGDQGKNRKPRDHNRDYDGKSLYASVQEIRERLPVWSAGKMRIAIDLHCPFIRGGINEVIYFVGGPNEKVWKEMQEFCKVLEKEPQGALVYSVQNNLPFGQSWNTPENFKLGVSFARWASEVPGVAAASTLEFPYANASGRQVTDETARAFGHDLARALQKYLENSSSER